jgi:ABC-type glycerol-3-phosphate transport system substrate-binding protein
MKRIVSAVAIVIMAATVFAACGEKAPEIAGKPYEHKNFTITIPNGWEAKEEMGILSIKKTETQMMMIMVNENNTDPIEKGMEEISKSDPNVKFVDVKIGEYDYKRFDMSAGQKSTNLLYAKDKIAMLISTASENFDGAEEQAIIASLKLK